MSPRPLVRSQSSLLVLLLLAPTSAARQRPSVGDTRQVTLQGPRGTLAVHPATGPGSRAVPRPPGSTPLPDPTSTWQLMSVPPGIYLRAISMGDAQVGFAAGEGGIVLKTSDGGSNWSIVLDDGYPNYYYGCHAIDPSTVVVSGFNNVTGNGFLRFSDDGGASWGAMVVLTHPSGSNWLGHVEFSDVNNGLVRADWSGRVYRTTNGGRTAADWSLVLQATGWFQGPFRILPDTRVWTAGIESWFTHDGGASWTQLPGASPVFDGATSFHQGGKGFMGSGTIFPTVQGWAHRSVNGGNGWTPSPVLTTPYPVRAICTLDHERAWAVGGDIFTSVGGIWSTIDGGVTWTLDQDTGNEMNDVDRVQLDSQNINVFVAGYVSQIWRSTCPYPPQGGLFVQHYCFCDGPAAPCGNVYHSAGCYNADFWGGLLTASGTSSVTADDLVIEAIQLPPQQPAWLLMADLRQRTPFGNGIACIVGGPLGLHVFPTLSTGNAGAIHAGPSIVAYTHAAFPPSGQIQAGQTWNFQLLYRDPPGFCVSDLNLTNALSVTFTP